MCVSLYPDMELEFTD